MMMRQAIFPLLRRLRHAGYANITHCYAADKMLLRVAPSRRAMRMMPLHSRAWGVYAYAATPLRIRIILLR